MSRPCDVELKFTVHSMLYIAHKSTFITQWRVACGLVRYADRCHGQESHRLVNHCARVGQLVLQTQSDLARVSWENTHTYRIADTQPLFNIRPGYWFDFALAKSHRSIDLTEFRCIYHDTCNILIRTINPSWAYRYCFRHENDRQMFVCY